MPLIEVSGTVASSQSIKGYSLVKFWEAYPGTDFQTKMPTTKHRIWSAWFDAAQPQLQEGDDVIITGELSCKVDKWIPKPTHEDPEPAERAVVAHNLNNCTITAHTPKNPVAGNTAPQTVEQELETPF